MANTRVVSAPSGERVLLTKCAYFALPLLLLLGIYVASDPFGMLWRPSGANARPCWSPRNRDFVSTELLLAHGADRDRYDAFVFGSSRSIPIQAQDWSRYLPNGARPFHYDASLESLFGIWSKVRYLDRAGYPLHYALLVVDAGLLRRPTNDDDRVMFMKHPAVSGGSWWAFQRNAFEGFLTRGFFIAYVDRMLFGKWRPYMEGILGRTCLEVSRDTNDVSVRDREDDIARRGDAYFRTYALDSRDPEAGIPSLPAIGERSREELMDMRAIFARHRTDVRVLISPMYDQRPINAADLDVLDAAFGRAAVYDFSGDNWVTRDRHNYYDAEHFRLGIGRVLLAKMYDRDGSRTLQVDDATRYDLKTENR